MIEHVLKIYTLIPWIHVFFFYESRGFMLIALIKDFKYFFGYCQKHGLKFQEKYYYRYSIIKTKIYLEMRVSEKLR